MKVDDLYLENLVESLTSSSVVKLKVHVNLAKQILHHFYDTQKAKGKKICATYYLSGMAPQKWISSLNSDNQIQENPAESYGDKDAYLVMLCKDFELEEMKKKFSRLYSVHVYGLSSSSRHTMDMLNKVLEGPLRDDDGNAPVHYGPISCKAAFEYREDPRLAPIMKNVEEVKVSVEMAKVKHDQTRGKPDVKNTSEAKTKSSPVKESKDNKSGGSSTAKRTTATDSSSGADKGRLKNMFAAAATRPKPKPKVEENIRKPSSDSRESTYKKKVYAKEQAKQKSKEVTRKRKRIRDVFSSSDEDEESKVSDDEGGLPESPIPKKRQQIESDSDEDFQEETKKPKSPTPPPVRSASGRRKVCKTVPRRHVDDQGFLVTVMEQVMVSESDHSDDETKGKKDTKEEKGTSQQKETAPGNSRKEQSVAPKKDQTSKAGPASNPPKKQATLMSFFKKK